MLVMIKLTCIAPQDVQRLLAVMYHIIHQLQHGFLQVVCKVILNHHADHLDTRRRTAALCIVQLSV